MTLDALNEPPPGEGNNGALAHPLALEQQQRLARKFYRIGEDAWCLVGNGLSNQTFIRGPQGIIAIDTGESVEEMQAALAELRHVTQAPIVACIYSHFHYVNGTQALLLDPASSAMATPLQIYGHAGIPANLDRFGGEIAPRSSRGIVHQFGLLLPEHGTDALLHCGLGRFFRNPEHAPFTPGYIPAQHTFSEPLRAQIAGLQVELMPAPSDSDDSITIWFPELGICVNNLVWPSLFNIYAIRGEAYRDPRILLQGIDSLYNLNPAHLIGTHGPPVSGDAISPAVLDFRDAIQFIWDQTVRGANQGLRLSELTATVQLPEYFNRSYFTQQHYGLVEHHVRQIYNGLFGWLDEDESRLLPIADENRCERLIAGFGGADEVRAQADSALATGDLRWASELATWLVRVDPSHAADRKRMAAVMRHMAQQTSAANVRNWCLTRALFWEQQIDLSRFNQHRFRYDEVMHAAPGRYVQVLRVLLVPERAAGVDDELVWQFATGERTGLKIRSQVAIPTDGGDAELSLALSHETWAQILSGQVTFSAAAAANQVSMHGDPQRISRFLNAFDHPSFC